MRNMLHDVVLQWAGCTAGAAILAKLTAQVFDALGELANARSRYTCMALLVSWLLCDHVRVRQCMPGDAYMSGGVVTAADSGMCGSACRRAVKAWQSLQTCQVAVDHASAHQPRHDDCAHSL